MVKKVTAKQLLDLATDGAKVNRDDNKIELLLEALNTMIAENKLAHEKHLKEIKTALKAIAENIGGKGDEEIKTLLTSIVNNTQYERPTYKFDIERDSRTQYMTSVTARPISTVH